MQFSGISNRLLNTAALPVVVFMLLFTILIYRSYTKEPTDFTAYYYATKMSFDATAASKIYEPVELNYYARSLGVEKFYAGFSPNSPFVCLLFLPFTLVDVINAQLLFNLIGSCVFLICVFRLFGFLKLSSKWLLLVPLLFYFPLRSNIYFGQFYLIIFALLSEGFIAYQKKQTNISSVLWAFAIALKIFPVFLLFFLFIKKDFKSVLKIALIGSCLLLASLLIQGWAIWKIFIFEIFPRSSVGEIHASFSFIYQTGFMFFKMLFDYDELRNPNVLSNNYFLFVCCVFVFKLVIVLISIAATLKNKVDILLGVSIWLFTSLLLLPLSTTYSLIVLLFPFILCIRNYDSQAKSETMFILILILIITTIPVMRMLQLPLAFRYTRFYLTLLYFAYLITKSGFTISTPAILFALAFSIVSTLGLILNPEAQSNGYLITTKEHELITKLFVKNNHLAYSYWSIEGEHTLETPLILKSPASQTISICNSQLCYNSNIITHSKDLKASPVIVNDTIYYLSDLNQGYGFYAIRKLAVK